MPPYKGGGEMIEHVHVDDITYGKPPHKFEAGTPPIVEAIGLGAALNYMMQVGRDRIAAPRGGARGLRARAARASSTGSRSTARAGQGRHRLLHHRRAAPARHRDHHRPLGRRGARRPPLRAAADGAARRHGHLPRLVRHVQHQGRGRRARRGAEARRMSCSPDAMRLEYEHGYESSQQRTTAAAPDAASQATPRARRRRPARRCRPRSSSG